MTEEPLNIFGSEAAEVRDQLAKVRHRHINTWLAAARKLQDTANSILNSLNQPGVRLQLNEFIGEDDIEEFREKAQNLSQTAFPLISVGNFIRRNPATDVEEAARRADLVQKYRQAVIDSAEQLLTSLVYAFIESEAINEEDLPNLLIALRAEVDIDKWVSICRRMRRLVLVHHKKFDDTETQALREIRITNNALYNRDSPEYVDILSPKRREVEKQNQALEKAMQELRGLEKSMYGFLTWCDMLLTMDQTRREINQKATSTSIATMDEIVRFFSDYRSKVISALQTYLTRLETAKAAATSIQALVAN